MVADRLAEVYSLYSVSIVFYAYVVLRDRCNVVVDRAGVGSRYCRDRRGQRHSEKAEIPHHGGYRLSALLTYSGNLIADMRSMNSATPVLNPLRGGAVYPGRAVGFNTRADIRQILPQPVEALPLIDVKGQ